MAFYLDGMQTIINNNKPSGKSFVRLEMWGDAIFHQLGTDIMHRSITTYGTCRQRKNGKI